MIIVTKNTFSDGTTKVRCKDTSIKINIDRGEILYFAKNEEFNICDTGASIKEAVENFEETLVFFYNFYKDAPDCLLTPYARNIRDIYLSNLKIEEGLKEKDDSRQHKR